MLSKIVYIIGIYMRNNKIFNHYNFLLDSMQWDIKKLYTYQYNKLKDLLYHAYENSEYYMSKYDKNNFHPSDVQSLADLQKIPLITKEELLNNACTIQVKNCSEKLFYSETSGSSGKPLVFYRNKDWDAWHRASVYRGYSWYNVNPWYRNGYFWGYNMAFKKRVLTKFLDFLQNRFRLFSYNEEEINNFIKKLQKASYLEGYSSMIYEVAKLINKKNIKHQFNLKMVKGTSEMIFDKYQNEVQSAFGKKIISEYGAAEAGIIAFECPQGNAHINMETVIVEENNNEIIVTNLVSKSFPIIRYKLGDYIQIDKNIKCDCGMQHLVIKEIIGRIGKVIYGFKECYPSLTLYYIFKNLVMEEKITLNYQAIQTQKGHMEFRIENKLTKKELDLLKKEFHKYFGEDLLLKVVDEVNLKFTEGKKTDFISLLE